jgi:hypothetical protein
MTLTILVLIFYIFWAMISILSQGESPVVGRLKAYDLFNMIPNYKFFCPNPIKKDYHLYYRNLLQKDQTGEWKEIIIGKRNRVIGCIWNPAKRDRKVFYKAVRTIRKQTAKKEKVLSGHMYLLVLNMVKSIARNENSRAVQFKLTAKQNYRTKVEEVILFTSPFDELSL